MSFKQGAPQFATKTPGRLGDAVATALFRSYEIAHKTLCYGLGVLIAGAGLSAIAGIGGEAVAVAVQSQAVMHTADHLLIYGVAGLVVGVIATPLACITAPHTARDRDRSSSWDTWQGL
jgi:hypothetical protein